MIATRLDEIVRDYTRELGRVREELGAERVRREMAETTLREGMAEEQRRREQAERERDDLCQELEAIIAARESPYTGEEQQGRDPRPVRYSSRGSGKLTEVLMAQADREVMARCRNDVSSCSKSYARQSRHETC
jgi:hypothetical protein